MQQVILTQKVVNLDDKTVQQDYQYGLVAKDKDGKYIFTADGLKKYQAEQAKLAKKSKPQLPTVSKKQQHKQQVAVEKSNQKSKAKEQKYEAHEKWVSAHPRTSQLMTKAGEYTTISAVISVAIYFIAILAVYLITQASVTWLTIGLCFLGFLIVAVGGYILWSYIYSKHYGITLKQAETGLFTA